MAEGRPLVLPDGRAVAEQAVIEACRADPVAFIEYVLDVEAAPVHEQVQDHYTEFDECGIGLHRGCGKTVQTIGRVAWEIGRTPTERVKYIQANDGEASKSVDTMRRIVESPRYKHVYPGLMHDPTCWGKTAFRFLTDVVQRDPTVEGCGIFGHAGGRATTFVFDDVCDLENAVRKPALRSQVKEAYHNTWRKMLTGDRRRVWCIFTPWHVDDLTAEWREAFTKAGTLLWVPVIGHASPWPEMFSEEWLALEEERNPIAYARAFQLEPLSAEVLVWPAEWIEAAYFTDRPKYAQSGQRAVTMDFAFSEKRMIPAKGSSDPDWSVSLFGLLDGKGHVWVEDMIRQRTGFPAFKRATLLRANAYGVSRGRAEAVGGQRGLVQQLNEDSEFPIEAVDRVSDKVFRAAGLQSFVSSGRFHVQCTRGAGGVLRPLPQLQALVDEMALFPSGQHDDTVDTAMDMMEMAMSGKGPIMTELRQGAPTLQQGSHFGPIYPHLPR